ncbi:HAMP domain-containing histidine kinase [Cyanobium sp. FGCU-52]|nr:HAMP domain-containing histidine kinase [Cyanobium sp. FGCU52]
MGTGRSSRFGSLLVQLHLAVLGTAALGFAAAAGATIQLNRQALVRDHLHRATSAAEPLVARLDAVAASPQPVDLSALSRAIDRQSRGGPLFWIRRPDGRRLLSRPLQGIDQAPLFSVPGGSGDGPGPVTPRTIGNHRYLVHRHHRSTDGTDLWVAEDVNEPWRALVRLLMDMLLIWLGCLALTLLALTLLTRRIIRPLRELNRMAAAITTDTLATSRLALAGAPREVQDLAEAYNSLLDRLAHTWDHQRSFVSAVSHELRNPLTIISGYLRRLQRRGGSLQPEQLRALATAEAETHRITRLLNDLLDLSRSESGRLELLPGPVAVDEILLMACDLARSQLARRLELRLPQDSTEQPVMAIAEADRLQQVVLNLIENADKYTPDNAPIEVELVRERDADGRPGVAISVSDRGIGIPPDDLPRIFERFHRAANALDRARGSGLGLSIVNLLVEAMGGRIEVESELGQGSCFRLHLRAPEAGDPGAGPGDGLPPQ